MNIFELSKVYILKVNVMKCMKVTSLKYFDFFIRWSNPQTTSKVVWIVFNEFSCALSLMS